MTITIPVFMKSRGREPMNVPICAQTTALRTAPLAVRSTAIRALFAALICAAICAAAAPARAQGSRKDDVVLGPTGRPMAGVSVAICTEPATTTAAPCSPLAALYSDSALTHALANPLATDGLGNYFFYAAPGKYTIEVYGPGVTTRILPDVILPSDPSAPTFASVTTTSGISAFSLSLAGNLAVGGNVAVSGTLTVGGVPVTGGGGGGNLSANNTWTGTNSFKGPIPFWDITAWGASGSSTTTTGTIAASSATIALGSAIDFANGEGVMIPGAGPTSSLSAPTGVAAVVQGATGSTSHTYKIVAVDALRGVSANTSVTITNAPTTLTAADYIQGAITPINGAAFYAIYKDGSFWDTFAAEPGPIYSILSISNTGGTTTARINQECIACNYAIVGSQVVVSGTVNYNGTHTITSVSQAGNFFYLQWAQSGSPGTETSGSIAQPVKWVDRGAGVVSFWPLNVPGTPPTSATAQWLVTTIASGGGTTSLTLSSSATTAVTGGTVYHDDSAAINAAANACSTVRGSISGGIVYAPAAPAYYNAYGVLHFPATTYDCDFRLVGVLNIANTLALPQGWSIHGLGGWDATQFASGPIAAILDADSGVLPTIYSGSSSGNDTIADVAVGGYPTNGVAVEISANSGEHLNNVQASAGATSYGPLVKLSDACCWTYINDGTFQANGIDDSIWIEGTGETTPSNEVFITGTILKYGGVKLWEEAASQGANMVTFDFENLTSESMVTALVEIDTLNVAVNSMKIAGGMYDTGPHGLPLINIVGYYNPIQNVTIENPSTSGGGDLGAGYVGSSILSAVNGGNPCIWDLNIFPSPSNGMSQQGTVESCGFIENQGNAGLAASRVTATDDNIAFGSVGGQQGGSLNVSLQRPQGCAATVTLSGGSLADGTYTYIVTALNGLDVSGGSTPYESWWSQLVSATISGGGGAGKVSVTCSASAGAASYRLYGRTGGPAGITGYVAGSTFPIVDTGASLTSASLPLEGTEAGNASVVRFTASGNHYILQGDTGFGTAAPQHVIDAAGDYIRGQAGFINGGHMNQSAANSDFAGASACVSGAKTITFSTAYSSTPVILIFDETTHGGASITAKSASSFAVACTGSADAFDYIAIGNPN
jgi:hypothetical protein